MAAGDTHQVLEDQSQALVSVDDVVQGDDVGVLQVLQQGHCQEQKRVGGQEKEQQNFNYLDLILLLQQQQQRETQH